MSGGRADRQQEQEAQVPRRTSIKNFVRQYGDLVLDLLWDMQPVKTGKGVGDMVCGSHVVDEPCRHVQY